MNEQPIEMTAPNLVKPGLDGVPVQTDNSPRPEDGDQDVSQDPEVAYDEEMRQ